LQHHAAFDAWTSDAAVTTEHNRDWSVIRQQTRDFDALTWARVEDQNRQGRHRRRQWPREWPLIARALEYAKAHLSRHCADQCASPVLTWSADNHTPRIAACQKRWQTGHGLAPCFGQDEL
jgi:hypothetical protein